MNIKLAYHYLFYKIYQFFKNGSADWLSDWKAELLINVLFIFLGLSFVAYYAVATKELITSKIEQIFIFIYLGVVVLCNYFTFHHRDQWKMIVQKFDQWPKRKNRFGGLVVLVMIALIIINLIFSFYLMSKISWPDYR